MHSQTCADFGEIGLLSHAADFGEIGLLSHADDFGEIGLLSPEGDVLVQLLAQSKVLTDLRAIGLTTFVS